MRVFAQGLGARRGTAPLRVHHEWTGLNTFADQDIHWLGRLLHADEILTVPMTTLDAHAAAEGLDRMDFLKIDAEGFELFVLRGARRLLSSRRVRWVLLEVGDGTCTNALVEPAEILVELAEHGYDLYAIAADGAVGARVEAFPSGSFSANFLAFADENR